MEEHSLLSVISQDPTLSPKSAAVALSLITNPSTSDPTLSAMIDGLHLHLQNPNPNPNLDHRQILSLLSSLSLHHPQFLRRVSAIAHAFILLPSSPKPSIPYAISLLDAADSTLSEPLCDESIFLSLCFSQCVKTRRWTLRNVTKFGVRPSVLLTVLLGFTKDPYPFIREAALDGLVLSISGFVMGDLSLVEGCYFRAVELLFDDENSVRRAAVCAVSECGQLLVALSSGELKIDWSNTLFVQLCLVAKDMDMEIRVDAFTALGKIQTVSTDLLLQTLSKKAFAAMKEKNYPGQYTAKLFRIPASASAFTFAHGLEDEFYEVRKSACHALQMLTVASAEFTGEAVHRVMDLLNDDSVVVRLQALETLHYMNMHNHLKVEESHLHMFLGSLLDSNASMRSATRKALQSIKLQGVAMFRSCIDVLIKSLELYPQDEAKVLLVLFKVGRNHGKFAPSFIQEVSHELEPSFDFNMGFNNVRKAALLVVAISAPVSLERRICSIPPQLFSYAVTFLDRISRGLIDVMDKNAILTYLTCCSRFTVVSTSEFRKEEGRDLRSKDTDILLSNDTTETSDTRFSKPTELKKAITSLHDYTLKPHVKTTKFMEIFYEKVVTLWPLIQLGWQGVVIQTLRNLKEELRRFTCESNQSAAALDFALKYVRVIKLLVKAWACRFSDFQLNGMGVLEILLGKTERGLKEMLYRFTGQSRENELHILELILLTYTIRFSYTVCFEAYMKKIHLVLSRVEHIHKQGSTELSHFVTELQNISRQLSNFEEGLMDKLDMLGKSLGLFSLRRFVLTGELKCMKAELDIRDNSFESPLPFVSGLPVGIPFEITLYNIDIETRLWLTMTFSESTQFVFLDTREFEGCNEIRKLKFIAPFRSTPNVKHFCLKVCIAMECLSEVRSLKHGNGPRHELVHLCKENEVYLANNGK